MQPGDTPVVVWGRPAAHFCLGQHQSAQAELVATPHVPVLRRPLGGGGVWLDSQQACVVLVAPREWFPLRTRDWYAHALAPIVRVYQEQALAVNQVEQDLWLAGRKLAGSGAASIGHAGLVGSSFLLKFPFDEFARLISSPSQEFSEWLQAALRQNITCWADHASLPDWDWLSMMYRRAAVGQFGWRWEQAMLRDDERAACASWHEELVPEEFSTKKMVPYGIKVRSACFLTERMWDGQCVRVLTRDGHFERVWLSAVPHLPETALQNCAALPGEVAEVLVQWQPADLAQRYAEQVIATACFSD